MWIEAFQTLQKTCCHRLGEERLALEWRTQRQNGGQVDLDQRDGQPLAFEMQQIIQYVLQRSLLGPKMRRSEAQHSNLFHLAR